jgi:3'-phosphoadenosine 5'-phosphosulfate (PAPS) 3'-phosphatase
MDDATFTLTPKHEWDVVAGVALVESAGGFVATLDRAKFVANRRSPATLWVNRERSLSEGKKELLNLLEPHCATATRD